MLDFIRPYSDQLIVICSIAFTLSLLPQVWFNYKKKVCEIPYKTSVLTTIFMGLITLVYIANDFWLSVTMGTSTTVLWGIIAIQRYKYKKV